jgi:anthranilate/para-aminobenzoate synthase component I
VSVVREIAIAADFTSIARALGSRKGLAVLHGDGQGALDPNDARFSFVASDPVETSHAWLPKAHERSRGWAGFAAAPRWIGVVPYEATRAIERASYSRATDPRDTPHLITPIWNRYDAVVRIDRASGRVSIEADDHPAADRLIERLHAKPTPAHFDLAPALHDEPTRVHVDRIRMALKKIAAGDIYQVNLARELRFRWSGSALEAFVLLHRASPAPYGFFLDLGDVLVAGSSPELALEIRGEHLRTGPIKGTRPRGVDAEGDRLLAIELDADLKERAELTMAIDLHRNDLGRVAKVGSVRMLGEPHVVRGSVWSRVAEVRAVRAPNVSDEEIVRAMIPCGSVTGAPKVRAMEVIAELETFRRGLYTGVIGYVGRDGGVVLAMAIRTLEMTRDGRARYGVGGGIVSDSDPDREVHETNWKAAQLARLMSSSPNRSEIPDKMHEFWPPSRKIITGKEHHESR